MIWKGNWYVACSNILIMIAAWQCCSHWDPQTVSLPRMVTPKAEFCCVTLYNVRLTVFLKQKSGTTLLNWNYKQLFSVHFHKAFCGI